ncbi:MAG: hypothetical protein OXB98_19435 [Bryobacterales bacterium]|nr:hypothetical protein [Bryobacterales bacterium]
MTEISKIDYKPSQDNVQFLGLDIHNPVFFVSSLTIIAFVAGALFPTANCNKATARSTTRTCSMPPP